MPRSKIIKDIIDDNLSTSRALQALLVITSEFDNKELTKWIKSELNGYENNELPKYRKNLPCNIIYSGYFGRIIVRNQPLPIILFGDETDYVLSLNKVKNSILELENLGNNVMRLDLTHLAGTVIKNSGIACNNISMEFPSNVADLIISNVKTNVLEILLILEKEYGILDNFYIDLDENDSVQDNINKIIDSTIFSDGAPY